MKKLFVLGAFAMFVFASCKKEYTCSCITTSAGVQTGTTNSTIEDTKKNAEEACDKGDASISVLGVSTATECSIK